MSFSSQVREELAGVVDPARHCSIALLAALFHLSPILSEDEAGIRTESEPAANAFANTVKKVMSSSVTTNVRGREITVTIHGKDSVRSFLEILKLDRAVGHAGGGRDPETLREIVRAQQPAGLLLQKTCCRRAYLRGMFLSAGSVNDPARSYHLEIVPGTEEDAQTAESLLRSLGFGARTTRRKDRCVVYLKEGEQISDFLGAMGATRSLMDLENTRILRDIAGTINRQVNFEAANLKKTGIAANRQSEDIAYLEKTVGINSLPPGLQQAARLRLDHPDASLQELSELSDPPVGKSGINHRLQRLSRMADQLRGKSGQREMQ